jgi:hypothetical protein
LEPKGADVVAWRGAPPGDAVVKEEPLEEAESVEGLGAEASRAVGAGGVESMESSSSRRSLRTSLKLGNGWERRK